jgi:GNAT superfamily N-acetyltransferase
VSFYRDAGVSRFAISVSPRAQPPDIPAWLETRGLTHGKTLAKAWRAVETPPEVETDLRIEVIGPSEAPAWAAVQRAAWGMPAGLTPWFTSTVGRAGWLHLLGFDDETPVTAAALFVSADVGWLGFGATIPTHRRRGGHRALIARRIREAAGLGCSLLITETDADTPGEPNPSYHNLVRAGFRLAYLRPNYVPAA